MTDRGRLRDYRHGCRLHRRPVLTEYRELKPKTHRDRNTDRHIMRETKSDFAIRRHWTGLHYRDN